MKKTKISLMAISALLTLIAVFATSCEKEELDATKKNYQQDIDIDDFSDYTVRTINYIDYELTRTDLKNHSDKLMNSDGDFLVVERQIVDSKNKILTIERHGFTTEEKYINFGLENNYPLKEEIEFTKKMKEYIEKNNVEEFYKKNGKYPEGYKEYEEYLYSSIFPKKDKGIPSLLIGLTLSKGKYGTGGHWVAFIKTWPVMLPGWNNEVSSYQPIGLAGVVSFYGRTFYRNHMFTRVQWACTWYNMPNWADDAVSSWIRI